MKKRTDPLIPILGSAVSLVVVGAILLVFYPRVSSWLHQGDEAVVVSLPDVEEEVPLWTCSPREGVALLIEPLDFAANRDDGEQDPALDAMLEGGPYRYYRLAVFHFGAAAGALPYRLDLPDAGFDSPEGGARLRPAAALLPDALDAAARAVLTGLGAVPGITVEPRHRGQILLAANADVVDRTAFVSGTLRFERRKVTRFALARWHRHPELESFLDF